MDLVLFGIQGSGKGTQAKKLAKDFQFDIFEAGGELRKIAATDTALGTLVKSYIDTGRLVPHEIIIRVIKDFAQRHPKNQKILFDGIPRDLEQMASFDELMQEAGRDFAAIHLKLSPDEGIKRILGRAKIEGRADDADTEVIKRRMQTFTDKTIPVIEKYKKEGKVTEIEGMKTVDEVYEEMKKAIQIV